MEIVQVIAQNIQDLLDKHKISVSELSGYLGISRQTLTNYLKTTSTIDSVQLVKIADFFNIPAEYLLKDHSDGKTNFLFRSALHYEEAVDEIAEQVGEYLDKYKLLAKSVGKKISYLPEQYNLFVNYQNKVVDINFECQDYFAPKLAVDESLLHEIWQIADDQRLRLGMEGKGATSLISALTLRGINVIFMDLSTVDTFGLSICDEGLGCFIIVNSNSQITVERQLFTVAHEYGHIILHRPVYKRRFHQSTYPTNKKSLLDYMADYFASRLLCPPSFLQPYAEQFSKVRRDLNSIISLAIPIKLKLQISLQSLILNLSQYGFIPGRAKSDFYALLKRTGTTKIEPISIRDNNILFEQFCHERDSNILQMIRRLPCKKADALCYFLDYDDEQATATIESWEKEEKKLYSIFEMINSDD